MIVLKYFINIFITIFIIIQTFRILRAFKFSALCNKYAHKTVRLGFKFYKIGGAFMTPPFLLPASEAATDTQKRKSALLFLIIRFSIIIFCNAELDNSIK